MRKVFTVAMLLIGALASAQEEKEKDTVKATPDVNLPAGNAHYNNLRYREAEADYRISQSKTPDKAAASYNLGNAIYKQKQPSEAKSAYLNAIKNAKDKNQKHMAYHNLGNVLMSEKDYSGAAEAYKNALRNNPHDEETRYNYALAKSKIKKDPPPKNNPKSPPPPPKPDPKSQPQPNQGGGQDKDQNKNQGNGNNDNKNKKDEGDKDKDKGGQGNNPNDNKDQDKGKGDGDKQKKDGGEPEPKGGNPTRDRMKNMLDAMNNEEKKVQDKMNATKVKSQPKKQEKDW